MQRLNSCILIGTQTKTYWRRQLGVALLLLALFSGCSSPAPTTSGYDLPPMPVYKPGLVLLDYLESFEQQQAMEAALEAERAYQAMLASRQRLTTDWESVMGDGAYGVTEAMRQRMEAEVAWREAQRAEYTSASRAELTNDWETYMGLYAYADSPELEQRRAALEAYRQERINVLGAASRMRLNAEWEALMGLYAYPNSPEYQQMLGAIAQQEEIERQMALAAAAEAQAQRVGQWQSLMGGTYVPDPQY